MDAKVSVLCLLLFLSHGHSSDVMERQVDPVAAMTTVVNQLTAQANTLNTQLTAMTTELNEKRATVISLLSDLVASEDVLKNLTRQLFLNDRQLNGIDEDSHTESDHLSTRTTTLETPVAFTVHFTDDDVGSLHGDRGVLLFDQVQYQIGGQNYNTSTGNFTAPSKGVYAFFATVQRNDPDVDNCLQVTLRKNGRSRYTCQASACPPGYTTSSVTCVMHMNQGDTMSVLGGSLYTQVFGYIHTSFSGLKISPV